MPISDIKSHSAVTVGTTAVRVVPKATTDNASKIERTHVAAYVPSGTVHFALINESAGADPNDAAIKAAIYGTANAATAAVTAEFPVGERVELWAWTPSGTVSVTPHSLVARSLAERGI